MKETLKFPQMYIDPLVQGYDAHIARHEYKRIGGMALMAVGALASIVFCYVTSKAFATGDINAPIIYVREMGAAALTTFGGVLFVKQQERNIEKLTQERDSFVDYLTHLGE